MTSEIYIENYRLDISTDISSLITFELDNIRDFSARGTSWSKTIVLPGTSNNNKLFGHIFQIGQSNAYDQLVNNVGYNFNSSVSARCLIFQDQFQTFKGVLRLLQINVTNGRAEYEVAVFGELAGLNVSLSTTKLEDLDFSAYDHVFTAANIIASWDNIPGTGYYYPLIDYGQASSVKHDWDIRTFRPALYVIEYINKIFTQAGYRWSSDLFGTDRFKRLIIPNNNKELTSVSTFLVNSSAGTQSSGTSPLVAVFGTVVGSGFTIDGTNTEFTFNGAIATTVNITYFFVGTQGGIVKPPTTFQILKNSVVVFSHEKTASSNTWDDVFQTTVAPGDVIKFQFSFFDGGVVILQIFGSFSIDALVGIVVPTEPNDDVIINDALPKNIRQIDFLLGIVKLFNLYVYEDRFDSKLIYFKPYIDFYSTSQLDAVDWTYKLNRDKVIQIKPMSELNAKKYEFKYKPDSDYFNEQYRKRYGEGYGDYVFDSRFEFAHQTKSLEIIFSATVLVGYSGEDKLVSTIFKRSNDIEEKVDSNIRILQSKKVTGVTSWDILDGPSTVITSTTDYGYAGHLDDPDAPSNDLNFGVLRELFFTLVSGDITVTQFNVYWSSYMAEVTDKDSKLMSAWFYLKPKDILELDFSKKVFVDGVLFRLNSIKDYNTTRPSDCQVELLKVNYLIY